MDGLDVKVEPDVKVESDVKVKPDVNFVSDALKDREAIKVLAAVRTGILRHCAYLQAIFQDDTVAQSVAVATVVSAFAQADITACAKLIKTLSDEEKGEANNTDNVSGYFIDMAKKDPVAAEILATQWTRAQRKVLDLHSISTGGHKEVPTNIDRTDIVLDEDGGYLANSDEETHEVDENQAKAEKLTGNKLGEPGAGGRDNLKVELSDEDMMLDFDPPMEHDVFQSSLPLRTVGATTRQSPGGKTPDKSAGTKRGAVDKAPHSILASPLKRKEVDMDVATTPAKKAKRKEAGTKGVVTPAKKAKAVGFEDVTPTRKTPAAKTSLDEILGEIMALSPGSSTKTGRGKRRGARK